MTPAGTKRVLIAMTVPEDTDTHELALELDWDDSRRDSTVWEWEGFWLDVADGEVGPERDGTTTVGVER